MEPAPLLAELLGDRVDEGGGVVVERRLELGDPLGRRRRGVLLERPRGLGGDDAELGPGRGGASSTSSQAAQLPSSDQILAMAGRE